MRSRKAGLRRVIGVGGVMLGIAALAGAVALAARPSLEHFPVLEARKEAAKSGVYVRFIGTTGLVIADGASTLMVDGFVTRPNLYRVLFAKVRPDVERVSNVRERVGVRALDGLMVSHSHYDHAMDAPEWVRQAGGEIWGTPSTAQIARAEGIEKAGIVGPDTPLMAGRFGLRFFELGHAPGEMMRGDIGPDFTIPARVRDYRTGGGLGLYVVHGECRILVVPTAGKIHADLSNYPADVLFLSIGQLGLQDRAYIENYWRMTAEASGAKLVVPIHWDDFTRALDKPVKPLPYVADRVDVALRTITDLAGDKITVALPVLFEPLDLSASKNC